MKQLILFALLIWGGFNFAQVPKTISYQGVLNEITGTPVADGDYSVAFKLYESEAVSQAVWEEVQQVSVASGIFNTILGKANPLILPFDKIYWLGITINSDAELTPRTQLTASPYSFNTLSISDSIVTGSKIKNGQVVRSINSMKDNVEIVGGDNIDLSVQNNSIVISSQGSDALSFPYFEEVETSSTAFGILNSGNGNVATFSSSGQDRINSVLQVTGEGNGILMNVLSQGKGGAAFFEVNDIKNQNNVITGNNHGIGVTAEFTNFNQNNENPTILANQNGLGNIAEFRASNQTKVSIDKSGNLSTQALTVGSKIIFPDGSEQSTATLGTGNYWNLDGNSNINADDFLGTIDNKPFEIRVNNTKAFRIEPIGQSEGFSPNIVGGVGNSVSDGVRGAFIGGGGFIGDGNRVTGDHGVIGGGSSNIASFRATIGGGNSNTASADYSVISGGSLNVTSGDHSSISGGKSNHVSNSFSTIGGGESNEVIGNHSTIAGGEQNKAGVFYSTVGGGRNNNAQSLLAGNSSARSMGELGGATVSGGESNQALSDMSTIGGGQGNGAAGSFSTIGGGRNNLALSQGSTVAGGNENIAAGFQSAIGGGDKNIASGQNSTVPGGDESHARGDYSFAAGYKARSIHKGSFVWNDRSVTTGNDSLVTTGENQFIVRAIGGVGFKTNNFAIGNSTDEVIFQVDLNGNATLAGTLTEQSDRNAKTNISPVDTRSILSKVITLPISSWSYLDDPEVKHIGPMSQDFKAAFEVGSSEKSISVIDRDGVALAAIQGLWQMLVEKDNQIRDLHLDIKIMQDRISRLEEGIKRKSEFTNQ